MASQQRNERLLMRQRGAGREVKNADFGLNFGFATTRLSGRGSRSLSKTPATQRIFHVSQASTRRSREPSQARSQRSASATSVNGPIPADISRIDHEQPATARPTKRRRTMIYEEPVQEADEILPHVDGSADVDDNNSDHDEEAEKENRPLDEHKPRSKKRKRKSIGQQSLRKKKRPSGESIKSAPPTSTQRKGLSPAATASREASLELGGDAVNHSIASQNINNDPPEETTKVARPTKKRRKRRSITFSRRKRTSTETAKSAVSRQSTESTAVSQTNTPTPEPVEREDSEDDYVQEDRSPEPTTPAPARKGRDRYKPNAQGGAGAATKSKGSKSFPIIAHRLTNFEMLPIIDELGESDLDSEEERSRDAERKLVTEKAVPNTVDVLAQYCRETVDSAVGRLDVGVSTTRAERKRQQTALEYVGHELQDRLFEMSTAIEHRTQLERRTRKAKRSRAELQARWLDIRRQREEVALRSDHIRQQNWEREQERETKWALSEAAHKLELEVERAEHEDEESLEYMLRTVAGDVSDVQGGGILNRIKSFNNRLERMAEVLEGRN